MNKGTQEICNKMTINDYYEALEYVNKALIGLSVEMKKRIMQQIKSGEIVLQSDILNPNVKLNSYLDTSNLTFALSAGVSVFFVLGGVVSFMKETKGLAG